ncbi:alpha-crystallin domain 32.1 [Euphorbia peplus]|nr:alpha-crystallin domain 32.1 [Euphorbia peplus]
MEKEEAVSVRRRMKMISAHFSPPSSSEDIISAAAHLLPLNCSGSLNSRFTRYDNRMYYARQASASQPFFMRPLSTTHQQREERASNCSEEPLFSRPITKMEPNFPKLQSTPKDFTQAPKFARPASRNISSLPNGKVRSPRMDVAECGRRYIIIVEIPGVNVNDIRVELNDTHLRIMGKWSNERSKSGYEIIKGPYQLSWPLPSDANKDSVSAEFLDGILQIIVPKL